MAVQLLRPRLRRFDNNKAVSQSKRMLIKNPVIAAVTGAMLQPIL